jgi:hypothetical protein
VPEQAKLDAMGQILAGTKQQLVRNLVSMLIQRRRADW